ncbi:hypothetical protein HUJ05_012189 [Dendroctonus ponderosae]|nr:hypothetical protein HUJ05_012189 [Dendroctonus ponderosae]
MIFLSSCLSIGNSEYPRFKRKGMPQNIAQRLPPQSQFGKKWGKPPQNMPPQFMQGRPQFQGPRMPPRGNRPSKPPMGFNMHMAQMQQHSMYTKPKFQQFQQFLQPEKTNPGQMKDFFKKPNQLQHPVIQNGPVLSGQMIHFPKDNRDNPKNIPKHEKPSFVSSPAIPTGFEYDYHVQTNNIPMNINTIKQVGEKGPIHTIPAPNLSLADKPSHVELRRPQNYQLEQQINFQEPQFQNGDSQAHHQYQVTEHNEQTSKRLFTDNVNEQTHYISAPSVHMVNQPGLQSGNQGYQNVQSVFYGPETLGVTVQENGNRGINIGISQEQLNQPGEDMVFSNSERYQVENSQVSNGPRKQNLQTQAIQSNYQQHHPEQIAKFAQNQEPQYVQRYRERNNQEAEENNQNIEPEFHSFNYDEQAHQAQAKSDASSGLVTATYSLGPGQEKLNKEPNINSRSSSVDPLTQSQIVQSYFDTSSLPSKDAADRLATLQAAGKVNSNLMQMGSPQVNQDEKDDALPAESEESDSREQLVDYDDYSQESDEAQSDEQSGFGQKLRI